jgi:tyrosinase
MSDGFLTGSGGVHMVGFFLHWHRYFVATYERALRDECGYTGAQPYWNWSLDAASGLPMEQWPIYNPDYGFGGNGPYTTDHNATISWPYQAGQTGGGCVSNGPFVNMTVNVGPGLQIGYNPHCLHRGLNPDTIPALKKEKTDAALLKGSFVEFDTAVQGAQDMNPEDGITIFHGAGHYAQGGDSTDFISSTSGKFKFCQTPDNN